MAERCLGSGGGLGRPRRALATLAVCMLASGCYSYTEVSPAAVPPGSYVRLSVERGARVSVGSVPLPDDPGSLSGRVMEGTSAETLLLSVALRNGDPRLPSRGLRPTASVPTVDVERLEVRRLNRGRTAAAVTTGALLGLAVLEWAFNVTNANILGGDEPGGVNQARVVLFQFPYGLHPRITHHRHAPR